MPEADTPIRVEEATSASPELETVKRLYRKNSSRLGFLPLGAIDEFAEKGQILVARNPKGEVLAYMAFRRARGRVSIVHLCSDEARHGYPSLLVNRLKDLSREWNASGIGLYCRRDYGLASFWAKLGFSSVNSKPGRGADAHDLVFWWFDNGQADLFTLAQESEHRLKVVIDMNILFDLHIPSRERHPESRCLQDAWLSDSIALHTVSEVMTEISRNENPEEKRRATAWATSYPVIKHNHDTLSRVKPDIITLWGSGTPSERRNSDIRQVAMSIAANADVMLTADDEILSHAKEIETRWGLRVLRPADFISQIDELERGAIYRPDRLAGSNLSRERLTAPADAIVRIFQLHDDREKLAALCESLRKLIARPREAECRVVKSGEDPLCLVATEAINETTVIHLLRMAPKQSLAPTVIRHLLLEELEKSARQGLRGVKIRDPHISWDLKQILEDVGFRSQGDEWTKPTVSFIGTMDEVSARLSCLPGIHGDKGEPVVPAIKSAAEAMRIESQYWPLKVTDAGIDTWVVPIQPAWARVLFDKDSAAEELFGAKASLILNRENIFYSASKVSITPYARILWYVSDDKHERRSKRIRACSHLIASERGPAKEVFRKNRHLGVFEWSEIAKLSDGQKKEIAALRFRDTELFANEVSFDFTRTIGVAANFQGPVRITPAQFEQVYRKGTGLLA